MDEKLAILVKVYKDLLAYFPKEHRGDTLVIFNGDAIKIRRGRTNKLHNYHNPDEPYNLIFYSVFTGHNATDFIGEIAIVEDEPGVGFFPNEE